MGWGESVYMPGEGKGTQPQMQKRHIILRNGWYWENFRDCPEGLGENQRFMERVTSAPFLGLLGCPVGETIYKGAKRKAETCQGYMSVLETLGKSMVECAYRI